MRTYTHLNEWLLQYHFSAWADGIPEHSFSVSASTVLWSDLLVLYVLQWNFGDANEEVGSDSSLSLNYMVSSCSMGWAWLIVNNTIVFQSVVGFNACPLILGRVSRPLQ